MFRLIRDLAEALQGVCACLRDVHSALMELVRVQREAGPAVTRLEELERGRAMWEVDMMALVRTADGKYDAARNAESRARTMKKHYEKIADPFNIEGEELGEIVPAGDGAGGEEIGVPPVRVDVAPDNKTLALRYKFQ